MEQETKRLAVLTPEQEKRWTQLFDTAVMNGESDESADESAWQGLVEEWPELAQFDGCKP